ncbi:hypothetical protein [Nocardioides sp.]|uniref:hypothetical protein n=1 Tax=Nocardioides sp. TaxID=35761 RepID=UPI0037850A2D
MARLFTVIWRFKVTERMASDVNVAAAEAGLTRQGWLREAVAAHLARQREAKR